VSELVEVIEFEGHTAREALRKLVDFLGEDDGRVFIGAWNIPGDTDVLAIQAVIARDGDDGDPVEVRLNLAFYPATGKWVTDG
jgi:hypothetical protein